MFPSYEIRAGKDAPCELVAVLHGQVVRTVWEGTHTACTRVKDQVDAELNRSVQRDEDQTMRYINAQRR